MKKFIALLLCGLIGFVFVACDQTTIQQTTQTTTQETTTETTTLEPIVLSNYVEYIYADDIDESDKQRIERINETLITFLVRQGILEEEDKIIYRINNDGFNDYNSYLEAVYVDVSDLQTQETYLNVLKGLFDPTANFGLLYGLSYYITETLDNGTFVYTNIEATLPVIVEALSRVHLTDITYPCFYGDYTEHRLMKDVQDLSYALTTYIIQEHGIEHVIELLDLAEDIYLYEATYLSYLNAWLRDQGSTVEVEAKTYPVAFSHDIGYEMAEFQTPHAYWEIEDDYQQGYFKNKEDFDYCITCSYYELIETVQWLESEMDAVDLIAKSPTVDYNDLTITFTNSGTANWYWYNSADIDLINPSAFLHEYVHHITVHRMDFMANQAKKEWLACYFSRGFELSIDEMNSYMSINWYYTVSEGWVETELTFGEIFYDHYGRAFDPVQDVNEFCFMRQYLNGIYDDVNTLRYPYDPGYSSVTAYLLEIAGEEDFWLIMEDLDLIDDLLGITWDEFYQNWEIFVTTNYAWLDDYYN